MEGYMRLHERATASQEVRMRHEYEMSAILDENTRIKRARSEGLSSGYRKGEARGIVKGEAETSLSIAKSMKADGIPFMTISKYTGLSVEKIARL